MYKSFVPNFCPNDELSLTILRRIWLFSANKIKSSESDSKQPTQLIVEHNLSLPQKLDLIYASFVKKMANSRHSFFHYFYPKLSYRQGLKSVKIAGLELKTTSATAFFDELVAKALPLVKLDSTIKAVEDSSDSAPPLTFTTSPEADDDPDDKANASKTQWAIY